MAIIPNLIHFDTFNRQRPDFDKLVPYGFVKNGDTYTFTKEIIGGDFSVKVVVYHNGKTSSQVIDTLEDEEYINVRITSVKGKFVGSVRKAYQTVLTNIVENCFIATRFANEQTNRLADWILAQFDEQPDAPFTKSKETGVFRNNENQKWYALVTQVSKGTLEPTLNTQEAKQKVEIINIKVNNDLVADLHKQAGIYPAYHMNKKHWVTIVLGEHLTDAQLFELVRKSRELTIKSKAASRNKKTKELRTQIKYWVIPANPHYYDVIKVFKEKEVVYWYQGANFIVGDIVYMYLGKPYSAILYKCKVIETNIASTKTDKKGNPIKRMHLKRIKTFDKTEFTFNKLKQLGLTSIRGARGVPDAVVKQIETHTS